MGSLVSRNDNIMLSELFLISGDNNYIVSQLMMWKT